MRTAYRAGYKGITLVLEESRNRQNHDWIEPITPTDGTRYSKPQDALDAFVRAGAGTKKQFDLKPLTVA